MRGVLSIDCRACWSDCEADGRASGESGRQNNKGAGDRLGVPGRVWEQGSCAVVLIGAFGSGTDGCQVVVSVALFVFATGSLFCRADPPQVFFSDRARAAAEHVCAKQFAKVSVVGPVHVGFKAESVDRRAAASILSPVQGRVCVFVLSFLDELGTW